MQEIETQKGEKVLESYYSKRLDKVSSMTLYRSFVGPELPKDKLYVVLGTDSGLLIDYIETIATTGQRFIFLDKKEVIEYIKDSRVSRLSDKFELYDFESFEFEHLYENYQDYVYRNAIVLLKSLVVEDDKRRYQGVFSLYEELFHRFRIDRVDNRNFKKHFDLQLLNVPDLHHPLSKIKDKLKGDVPAIILGGGPSLDKIVPWLKINQKKIWIFAASRICKRLIKEGIVPDFIATLDPQPLIFEYSKEMFEFSDSSILITGEHPYPGLIKQWSGLKTYTRRRFPWAKGGEDNFISDGPTVTNALFGMAVYLGVTTVYLAGVDFCFTTEGVCHESGSIESKTGIRDKLDTVAMNYEGETVGTNIQLYDARNLLEDQLDKLKNEYSDLRVYNLSSAAAVIKGVEYLSAHKIGLDVDKFDIVKACESELYVDLASEQDFLDFLKSDISDYIKWFLEISRLSKQGERLTQKLFENTAKQSSRIKDIMKLKVQLEKLAGIDYQTMVNYAYSDFMLTLNPVESEQAMSEQEMVNAFMGFFKGLTTASLGFVNQLKRIQFDIKQRMDELNPDTAFSELASSWLDSGIPGRFYVWLKNFSKLSYDEVRSKYPLEVKQLEDAFQQLLSDDSALVKRMHSRLSDESDFVNRLQQAFHLEQPLVVQSIIKELKSLPEEQFDILLSFAQGLLSELQEEPEQALEHYLSVKNSANTVFLQQRIYPLAFTLKKFEQGIESLELLCQSDQGYLPKFAKVLEVLGNPQGAIEIYGGYPFILHDTDAMIHLLRLLVAQGEVTRANALLQQAEISQSIDQDKLKLFIDKLNATD